jgi:FKBP-type peptidyl-prolyl cis-trans isomerase
VKGWDKGCSGMRVGEVRRIFVPSNLAYGSKGNNEYEIKPNNDLLFEVECEYVRRFA